MSKQENARILVSMPESFLDDVDKFATKENRSRSELIREALRTYMYKKNVQEHYLSNPILNNQKAKQLEDLIG